MEHETQSDFRLWLEKVWQEHKEEVEVYTGGQPCYNREVYIKHYKWWLKSLYKRQRQNAGTS